MLSFAVINRCARITLASFPEPFPGAVLKTVSNSFSGYVWLPSVSVRTSHAEGWFFQNPCPRGHVLPGIVVVVEEVVVVIEGSVVVVLVVLVVVLVGG